MMDGGHFAKWKQLKKQSLTIFTLYISRTRFRYIFYSLLKKNTFCILFKVL